MTEIIVTKCKDCPFESEWFCVHPKAFLIETNEYSIPDDCPLIKEETVIKVKND